MAPSSRRMRDDDNDLETLPPIMRKIEEARRKEHKMLATTTGRTWATADEFARSLLPAIKVPNVSNCAKGSIFFLGQVNSSAAVAKIANTATSAFWQH